MKNQCSREHEVMETVSCGRWPEHCPVELRAHISDCSICRDVLDVALALHQDRDSAYPHAHVPSADLVWWRAELRARQEAMRTASRPITITETFGAAAGIGVAVALMKSAWPWLKTTFVLPDLPLFSFSQAGLVIVFALAVLVIAPLAYLALSDE